MLVGDAVPEPAGVDAPIRKLSALVRAGPPAPPPVAHTPDDVAEVIHVGSDVRAQGRRADPSEHPCQRHSDRTGDRKLQEVREAIPADQVPEPLPLSHMFGQAMATFVPPLLAGVVVFNRTFAPDEIVTQIRTRRISVLVSVPKILEVLRDYVTQTLPETRVPPPDGSHWMARWWRLGGLTVRSVSSSGRWWSAPRLSIPTSRHSGTSWFGRGAGLWPHRDRADRTLNHPFHASRGAVGKPIGVDVRIADDGEILVRGRT